MNCDGWVEKDEQGTEGVVSHPVYTTVLVPSLCPLHQPGTGRKKVLDPDSRATSVSPALLNLSTCPALVDLWRERREN
jgi:hypothetical protein